jgi:adenylate cyclase, class 2
MNVEIEIKVKIRNPMEVRKNLLKISRLSKEKTQVDHYYVPTDDDYFRVSPTKEYLRVRIEGTNAILGHHLCHYDDDGKLLKTEENETEVGDPETIFKILESLGFVRRVTVRKHREVYDYGNYEIVLDNIEELGDFLEVEVKKVTSSESDERSGCYKIVGMLEADHAPADDGGYPDMLIKSLDSSTD